jgi:hypothetical protein
VSSYKGKSLSAKSSWSQFFPLDRPSLLRAGDTVHTKSHVRIVAQVLHNCTLNAALGDPEQKFLFFRVHDSSSGDLRGPGEKLWRVVWLDDKTFSKRSKSSEKPEHHDAAKDKWKRQTETVTYSRLKRVEDAYASVARPQGPLRPYALGYGELADLEVWRRYPLGHAAPPQQQQQQQQPD